MRVQLRNSLFDRLRHLIEFKRKVTTSEAVHGRGPITHVIIMDGTLSSLDEGYETNAGLTFKLCCDVADIGPDSANMLVRYEAGIQWDSFADTMDVIEGRGINEQIKRVYGGLASRYRSGDKIFLFGYSRGAYAVRSLAGFIDQVGLLESHETTERNIKTAFRHYQSDPDTDAARFFAAKHCHKNVVIDMLGVWDTVAAVGLHFPVLWRFSKVFHEFRDLRPPRCARKSYHALAYDERRRAYAPVMFETNPNSDQVLQQMWFPGSHGDVGGQLSGHNFERRLSNATLVWMLDKAEQAGLELPNGWHRRFLSDPHGRSIGMSKGWGKFFWLRTKRVVGRDPSEVIHPAVKR
jgi:uncharacterized protein (DUF2235 family)